MCRHKMKVLEISHRRSKRLDLRGKLGYNKAKRKKPDGNDKANCKRIRLNLSCSVHPPRVPGRRKTTCRACGYAVADFADRYQLSCCNRFVHQECFLVSADITVNSIRMEHLSCSSMKTLVSKDRKTPLQSYCKRTITTQSQATAMVATPVRNNTRSATQAAPSEKEAGVSCKYCGKLVSMDDKRHFLYDCPALNQYYVPNAGENYSDITSLAMRTASATRLGLISETPPRKTRPRE